MAWSVVGHEDFDDDPIEIEIVVIVGEEEFDETGPADPGGFALGPTEEDR
jgi:hypothetical protein